MTELLVAHADPGGALRHAQLTEQRPVLVIDGVGTGDALQDVVELVVEHALAGPGDEVVVVAPRLARAAPAAYSTP